jgi:sulfite exporter TauE/SafE
VINPTELSVPAMLLAGFAASPHCALMCGPMQWHARTVHRQTLLTLHLVRLLSYTLIGALAGGLGGLWLRQLPDPMWGLLVQLSAALGLVAMGTLAWHRAPAPCGACTPARDPRIAPWFAGLLWGLLPCGLRYAMLFFALLSGSALQGGALLLAFGLGSSPLLIASGVAIQHLALWPQLRRWAPALMVALGIGSGSAVLLSHADQLANWCSTVLMP